MSKITDNQLSSKVVIDTNTQTLTNKTLDYNSNTILNLPSWGWWGGFLREVDVAGTQINNTILFEGAIGKATTLEAWYITLLTAPTGSSFVITVSKSTDSGATYPTTETVTLTATNKYVKWTLTTAFAEGNFIKAEITTIGSTIAGSNLLFSVTWT